MGVLDWIDAHQGLATALVVAGAYADLRFSTRPLVVRGLAILEALASQLPPGALEAGEKVAAAEVAETETRAAGALVPLLRVIRGGPAALLALGLTLALAGCVQCQINVGENAKGGRAHQDVGRVSSSDQAVTTTAEVPVSLVPK